MNAKCVPYVVSACLAGLPCRYDGGSNACAAVAALVAQGRAVTACPEGLACLPVPRPPCEQQGERVISRDGRDVTEAFKLGAERALQIALEHGCGTAILKSRSPSCGLGQVYDGTFSKTLCSGNGLWTALLRQAGIHCYTEECLPPELQEEPES